MNWNKGYCTASITSLRKYEGILILGSPFLKQHITHFDLTQSRLGLFEANINDIRRNERVNMGVLIILIGAMVGVGCKLFVVVAEAASVKREVVMCNI